MNKLFDQVRRQTKHQRTHDTACLAANDGCYGQTIARSTRHRMPNGRHQTTNVIASTWIQAEIMALDQMSFPA